jgi:hypothetical protein
MNHPPTTIKYPPCSSKSQHTRTLQRPREQLLERFPNWLPTNLHILKRRAREIQQRRRKRIGKKLQRNCKGFVNARQRIRAEELEDFEDEAEEVVVFEEGRYV